MMKLDVYSVDNKSLRTIEVEPAVFGREVSDAMIYYAVNNELANRRVGTACTKTRGLVNYTNNKPFKQKGTGNARQGDFKSPTRVGGGTIFGPQPRSYAFKMPKKMKRAAMMSILSKKVLEDRLIVLEDFNVESGKTRDLVDILKKFTEGKPALLILKDGETMIRRAAANIPWLKCQSYSRLAAHDTFYSQKVILMESTVGLLGSFFVGEDA